MLHLAHTQWRSPDGLIWAVGVISCVQYCSGREKKTPALSRGPRPDCPRAWSPAAPPPAAVLQPEPRASRSAGQVRGGPGRSRRKGGTESCPITPHLNLVITYHYHLSLRERNGRRSVRRSMLLESTGRSRPHNSPIIVIRQYIVHIYIGERRAHNLLPRCSPAFIRLGACLCRVSFARFAHRVPTFPLLCLTFPFLCLTSLLHQFPSLVSQVPASLLQRRMAWGLVVGTADNLRRARTLYTSPAPTRCLSVWSAQTPSHWGSLVAYARYGRVQALHRPQGPGLTEHR